MAEDKKLVEAITSMDVDFAQWYTDVCKKAELMSYSSVKGCMIFKPAGYAIWENIKNELDRRFKETGVENVYMPMFIPESLLEREKDHVEGFAPEVARQIAQDRLFAVQKQTQPAAAGQHQQRKKGNVAAGHAEKGVGSGIQKRQVACHL